MIISFICLGLSIACYSVSQLQMFGKLRWSKNSTGFWDLRSWNRKYKWNQYGELISAPNNWYYKYVARVKYRERWFTSTWLTVFATDGYHLCQALFLLCLSLSFSIALELENWKQYLMVYIGIHAVHFVTYRWLQR